MKEEAKNILKARLGRELLGIADPNEARRLKYGDVRDALLADYRNGQQAGHSLVTKSDGTETVWGLKYLDEFFGGRAAVDIKTPLLRQFIEIRKRQERNDQSQFSPFASDADVSQRRGAASDCPVPSKTS
jgi:hypothetical protein